MLLGFLMEKPMNAYEIKKEVENRNLSWWVKGSSPSIYRNIIHLANNGFLDGEVVRDGEMPEKTIYTINQKGILYFTELMEKYSTEPPIVYLDFTTVISNINKVDQKKGLELIDNLLASFRKSNDILKSIENNFAPKQAKAIIQLNTEMNELFCDWLKRLKAELYDNAENTV
jgi:Predicted transcriptional regulators